MKLGDQIIMAAAARLHAPLILMFALSLFVTRAPGGGVGLLAGLAFALAFVLHALVFGAAASRGAFPPTLARLILAAGVGAALAGAGAPGLDYAPRLVEGGLFAATASGAALIVSVLFGRIPTLRDAEW
jgi:multisubunit Na+/H+ antiporter MnhB subunit